MLVLTTKTILIGRLHKLTRGQRRPTTILWTGLITQAVSHLITMLIIARVVAVAITVLAVAEEEPMAAAVVVVDTHRNPEAQHNFPMWVPASKYSVGVLFTIALATKTVSAVIMQYHGFPREWGSQGSNSTRYGGTTMLMSSCWSGDGLSQWKIFLCVSIHIGPFGMFLIRNKYTTSSYRYSMFLKVGYNALKMIDFHDVICVIESKGWNLFYSCLHHCSPNFKVSVKWMYSLSILLIESFLVALKHTENIMEPMHEVITCYHVSQPLRGAHFFHSAVFFSAECSVSYIIWMGFGPWFLKSVSRLL